MEFISWSLSAIGKCSSPQWRGEPDGTVPAGHHGEGRCRTSVPLEDMWIWTHELVGRCWSPDTRATAVCAITFLEPHMDVSCVYSVVTVHQYSDEKPIPQFVWVLLKPLPQSVSFIHLLFSILPWGWVIHTLFRWLFSSRLTLKSYCLAMATLKNWDFDFYRVDFRGFLLRTVNHILMRHTFLRRGQKCLRFKV